MNRRSFLAGAVAAAATSGALARISPPPTQLQPIGRPVRVLSLSFENPSLETISAVVDTEAARGVDFVILPELWRGHEYIQTLDGPATRAMAALAAKHRTYILSPNAIDNHGRRMNAAVLMDRTGKVVLEYDDVFPSEFDHEAKLDVGTSLPVYQADFGKIGVALCFDINFPDVWKSLADQGAEIVAWPSAYPGGIPLQAHAINNHYYVVSSTSSRECAVYDITGEQILYQKSHDINVTHVTLDLDRGIYHYDMNIAKRDKLLAERPEDVRLAERMDREGWFVLEARRPGVSARALARQYSIEELRDYINRSRRELDAMRGWSFTGQSHR